ncbi:MAG: phage tail protein [Pseudoflavonifractor sp.]|nr:phage tail protein [Pseudoflavonifractor sp.]
MATTTATKSGYCNGSDMLLYIGGKAVGHCSTHTVTINSETKDRAVKPVASAALSAGLWKEKGVTGLSVSISAEGLVFYQETETGYKTCLSMVSAGQSVEVKCMERGNSAKPYLTGKFVIASLERVDPAQDDATYSISLENDGVVTFDESAITETTAAGS